MREVLDHLRPHTVTPMDENEIEVLRRAVQAGLVSLVIGVSCLLALIIWAFERAPNKSEEKS